MRIVINQSPVKQVEEALTLLEQAAQAFTKDALVKDRSRISSSGDVSAFLLSWAHRLAWTRHFLQEQIDAGVLDPITMLRLISFDIEVARDRLST